MSETLALTDLQIDLMRVLWSAGEATAVEVHREIAKSRDLAQPTVATLLSRLEKKGAIDHRTEGRQFIYRPLVTESEVRRSAISQLVDRLMGGDVPQLVHHLLSDRSVSAGDLAQIKALIEQREKETKPAAKSKRTKR